jgi:hypothetical protein
MQAVEQRLARWLPTLFAYQYLVRIRPAAETTTADEDAEGRW